MSIAVPSSEDAPQSLQAVLRQAGAVLSARDGSTVAVNYGSAAGELAVCVRAVGLVDRSDLSTLVIEASPGQLQRVLPRLLGGPLAPGGMRFAGGAWWCGARDDQIIVVCEPRPARRLAARLGASQQLAVGVSDQSAAWEAIELLGKATPDVLRALRVYGDAGDPRSVQPFSTGTVAGVGVMWLLDCDYRALALVPSESAGQVWRAIETAGRPSGISCVGWEAAARYAVLERTRVRACWP
jgi:glycine cleavage system aminomethyltransferase T